MISNNYLFTYSSERRRRMKFCLSFLAISKAKKKVVVVGQQDMLNVSSILSTLLLLLLLFALSVMLVALLLPQLLLETNRTTFLNRRTSSIKLWNKLDHFTIQQVLARWQSSEPRSIRTVLYFGTLPWSAKLIIASCVFFNLFYATDFALIWMKCSLNGSPG